MNRRQVFVIISNAGDGRNCFAFAMRPTGALMIYLDQDKQGSASLTVKPWIEAGYFG